MNLPESIVLSILGIIGGVVTAVIAARKQKAEIEANEPQQEVNLVAQYRELAAKQASDNKLLQGDIEGVRREVLSLRKELDSRDRKITHLDHVIIDYADWIRRLILQVRSLGGTEPVPFRTSYRDVDPSKFGHIE